MKALQQPALVQTNDVPPDGLGRNLEAFRQPFHGRETLGLNDAQQRRLVAVAVAVPVALQMARMSPRTRALVQVAVALAFSGLIVAYGFILVLGRAGFMTLLLARLGADPGVVASFLYGPGGLVLSQANPFVTAAIASGIGEARNAIIAQAGSCLIAVGDSHGTLSEVALGLRRGKRVFGLAGTAQVNGVVHLARAEELPKALAHELLKIQGR